MNLTLNDSVLCSFKYYPKYSFKDTKQLKVLNQWSFFVSKLFNDHLKITRRPFCKHFNDSLRTVLKSSNLEHYEK